MNAVLNCATGKFGTINALRIYLNLIPVLFVITGYHFINKCDKNKLRKDIQRNWIAIGYKGGNGNIDKLMVLLATEKCFRNIFYMRMGLQKIFFQWALPKMKPFNMATKSQYIDGGIFIQHGVAADINAKKIGENLWINQRVTIGHTAKGNPVIGDNVTIGVGAVVLGPITIGNNVKIGANAIVVEDIPDNVTVCSPKATIVRRF